jgi:glycerate-2-kinase
MTLALLSTGRPVRRILAIGTHRPADLPSDLTWIEGGHPLPDAGSLAAGRAARDMATGVPGVETLLVLLSGGASALMAAPADGLTLDAKRQTIMRMMHAGADIHALNTVRKHISCLKGGQLAVLCGGRTLTLAVSDVVGDDLSVIGSGPGVPDATTWKDAAAALQSFGGDAHDEHVRARVQAGLRGEIPDTPKPGSAAGARAAGAVIASRIDALEGAAKEADARGYRVVRDEVAVTGEARIAARAWWDRHCPLLERMRQPFCVIAGGETTVRVTGGGRGGRNQEFALALADLVASSARDVVVASLGTDGIDGPTDAAGALVDPDTLARASARGASAASALADNDTYSFFNDLGDLIRTGRTNTNVGDLQILLVGGERTRPPLR